MDKLTNWPKIESRIHQPGLWVLGIFAFGFFAIGGMGLGGIFPAMGAAALPAWAPQAVYGACFVIAVLILMWYLRCRSANILHADAAILPDVPHEPVVHEGFTIHGRLVHALHKTDAGWELGQNKRLIQNTRLGMLGFGIPFLIIFSAILAFVWHRQFGWIIAAILGITATTFCGGTAFLMIFFMYQAAYKRLSKLVIPAVGETVQFETTLAPDPQTAGPFDGLRWIFVGDGNRHQLSIPREELIAVQLVPWKITWGSDSNTNWALQGNLVVSQSESGTRRRLPLLLTSEMRPAAKLIKELGELLEVPFLFHADQAGWRAESLRAKTRPPLKAGGFVS